MSLTVVPEVLATASADLSGIGSALRAATSAAAPSTASVVAAARDEVSQAISDLFAGYGRQFQALSAQSSLFHDSFVQAMTLSGGAFSAAEAANTSPLTVLAQEAQNLGVFCPSRCLPGASCSVTAPMAGPRWWRGQP